MMPLSVCEKFKNEKANAKSEKQKADFLEQQDLSEGVRGRMMLCLCMSE